MIQDFEKLETLIDMYIDISIKIHNMKIKIYSFFVAKFGLDPNYINQTTIDRSQCNIITLKILEIFFIVVMNDQKNVFFNLKGVYS